MKINNVRPSTAGGRILARADVELEPGIRVYDVELRMNASGQLRVFAPALGD